jgi:hypothetical protein
MEKWAIRQVFIFGEFQSKLSLSSFKCLTLENRKTYDFFNWWTYTYKRYKSGKTVPQNSA